MAASRSYNTSGEASVSTALTKAALGAEAGPVCTGDRPAEFRSVEPIDAIMQ